MEQGVRKTGTGTGTPAPSAMALRNGPIGAAQAEECLRILDEIRSLENRLIELGRPDYAPLRADMAEWSTPEATR